MKIQFTRDYTFGGAIYREGDRIEIDDERAQKLVDSRAATCVDGASQAEEEAEEGSEE